MKSQILNPIFASYGKVHISGEDNSQLSSASPRQRVYRVDLSPRIVTILSGAEWSQVTRICEIPRLPILEVIGLIFEGTYITKGFYVDCDEVILSYLEIYLESFDPGLAWL